MPSPHLQHHIWISLARLRILEFPFLLTCFVLLTLTSQLPEASRRIALNSPDCPTQLSFLLLRVHSPTLVCA
eukprot:11905815-Alexandrium_andersonii.AAC.1